MQVLMIILITFLQFGHKMNEIKIINNQYVNANDKKRICFFNSTPIATQDEFHEFWMNQNANNSNYTAP